MGKSIFEYGFNFELAKYAILKLAKIGEDIGNDKMLWADIKVLREYIFDKEEMRAEWQLEKTIIASLQKNLVDYSDILTKLRDEIKLITPNTKKTVSEDVLGFLGLRKDIAQEWNNKCLAVDGRVSVLVKELGAVHRDLSVKLKTTLAILSPAHFVVPYNMSVIKEIVAHLDIEFDPDLFFKSIYEMRQVDGEKYDLYFIAIKHLSKDDVILKEEFEWNELILFILYLDIVVSRGMKLDRAERHLLLQNYFYKAIFLGFSMRDFISSILLSSRWVGEFVTTEALVVKDLDENNERIWIGEHSLGQASIWLWELFFEVKKKIVDNIAPKEMTDNIVQNIYRKIYVSNYQSRVLKDALDIYFNLRRSTLVDWFNDKNHYEGEEYKEDMLRLFAYFAYGENFIGLIKYFEKDSRIVPLKMFFQDISRIIDLTNKDMIEKLLALTEILHNKNLLPQATDIIIFHQSDSKFHWNEEALGGERVSEMAK